MDAHEKIADPGYSGPSTPPVLSVGQLTFLVKDLLEAALPTVWVSGEISNLSRPQSGHYYFTLKDEDAQIRAVVWRTTAQRMKVDLQDGMDVICEGGLEVYPPRGSYQLVVRELHLKGVGALEQKLRRLHEKLKVEGLFDPARKRTLPMFPRRIAFVTSPTGAAIRDFLESLRHRWHGVCVLIVPVRVQGPGAAEEIAAAIAQVNRLAAPIDTLVVGRGGGSLEDLWAFNEEVVVRAIHASRIPVVSAVGHEIDVTLSDLVADVRALTPTDAAQRVVPAADDVKAALADVARRMQHALRRRCVEGRSRLEALSARRPLRRPFDLVHDLSRRIDEFDGRLRRSARQQLQTSVHRIESLAAQLESLSPLAVLARGYSVTTRATDGQIVRNATELQDGEQIVSRFHEGQAVSRIERQS
ncbi:MAG: exodeoxyribonuclease VII large subunit [Planctomycetes bacterium]|nr:exodeoxyribonuclease VII large subunit [Planctomycetota bacterium]